MNLGNFHIAARDQSTTDDDIYLALQELDLSQANPETYGRYVREPVQKYRPQVYERVLGETVAAMIAVAYPPEQPENEAACCGGSCSCHD